MKDHKRERHQHENEKKHIGCRVAMKREVDIELCAENNESNKKREYWARPNKNQEAKKDEECVPQRKGNRRRDIVVYACKNGSVHL